MRSVPSDEKLQDCWNPGYEDSVGVCHEGIGTPDEDDGFLELLLEKGNTKTILVGHQHHNNLIIISVNEGFSEDVMQVARKAGATGGTIIKGRLADSEQFSEYLNTTAEGEREMICILAPSKVSAQIMQDVNRDFGLTSEANGIIFALPTEKAFKI